METCGPISTSSSIVTLPAAITSRPSLMNTRSPTETQCPRSIWKGGEMLEDSGNLPSKSSFTSARTSPSNGGSELIFWQSVRLLTVSGHSISLNSLDSRVLIGSPFSVFRKYPCCSPFQSFYSSQSLSRLPGTESPVRSMRNGRMAGWIIFRRRGLVSACPALRHGSGSV